MHFKAYRSSCVTIAKFIRAAIQARMEDSKVKAVDYYKDLYKKMDELGIDRKFTARALNDGFSGGEKKDAKSYDGNARPEILHSDETDSGLDIDALRVVSEGLIYEKCKQRIPRHHPLSKAFGLYCA